MEDKKTTNYDWMLFFRNQLDLTYERNEAGIQANICLGQFCQNSMSTIDNSERKQEALNDAVKYYMAALTLARELDKADCMGVVIRLLKSIGRDEAGNLITNDSNDLPVVNNSMT